jgi:hypothetical protein
MKIFITLLLLCLYTFGHGQSATGLRILSVSRYDPNSGTYNDRCGRYNDNTGQFCDCNNQHCITVAKNQINFRQCCKPVDVDLATFQNKTFSGTIRPSSDSTVLLFKTDTASYQIKLSSRNAFMIKPLKSTAVSLIIKDHLARIIEKGQLD